MLTIKINGGCTPSIDIEVDFDENPNGLPVVWLRTGYKEGVYAPLAKEAVEKLVSVLQKMLLNM